MIGQLDLFKKETVILEENHTNLMYAEKEKIESKDPKSLYLLRSALHKEIRRSDFNRAMQYAKHIRLVKGKGEILRYCRNVCFEESRNVELNYKLKIASSNEEMDLLKELILSKKKWNIQCRKGLFLLHCVAGREKYENRLSVQGGFSNWANKATESSMLNGYRFWFKSWDSQEIRTEMFLEAKKRVKKGNVFDFLVKANKKALCHYSRKILVEAICGYFDDSCYEKLEPNEEQDMYLPTYQNYVFDNHTSIGIGLLKGNGLLNCKPNQPLPKNIDLRVSGLLRGVLWRELIGREVEDITSVPWESVDISNSDWLNTQASGLLYYKSSHDKYGIRY